MQGIIFTSILMGLSTAFMPIDGPATALYLPKHPVAHTNLDVADDSSTQAENANDLIARQTPTSTTGTTAIASNSPAPQSTGPTWSPYLNMKHWRGFNVVNESPVRYPKWNDAQDWTAAFKNIKALPNNFNAVRLYSTTDGDGSDPLSQHLELALPAATSLNLSVHVGIWSGGDTNKPRFTLEKAALDRALQANGCNNIVAVSVGNEDLYSKSATVNLLVDQINEISALLDSHNCCHVPVTHTDTWSEWTMPENVALVQAVDFLTVNIFPYWENSTVELAFSQFEKHINQTIDYAARYDKEVWIGETGWPFNGSARGDAQPSVQNMQTYYSSVVCPALNRMNTFVYALWDWPDTAVTAKPAFGLLNSTTGQPSVYVECPGNMFPFAGKDGT